MIPSTGSEWVVRMRSGTLSPGEREQMQQWMDESPERARDLLRAETAWRLSGALANDELLRRELAELDAMPAAPRRAWEWRPALSMAATAAAVAVSGFFWYSQPMSLATPVGGQRTVALPDGSTVALNTDTRLEVSFTENLRDIRLLRGEALFQVAQDATRPFMVHTAAGSARAVGTRFNVLADDASGDITVSVLEGRVAVKPGVKPTGLAEKLLEAGESVACTRQGRLAAPVPEHASLRRIAAWREGKLRFDNWPLERAVSEYNRYAAKPIVLDNFPGHPMPVSGVFRIGDSETFPDALVELMNGQLVDEGKVLRLKAGNPDSFAAGP